MWLYVAFPAYGIQYWPVLAASYVMYFPCEINQSIEMVMFQSWWCGDPWSSGYRTFSSGSKDLVFQLKSWQCAVPCLSRGYLGALFGSPGEPMPSHGICLAGHILYPLHGAIDPKLCTCTCTTTLGKKSNSQTKFQSSLDHFITP
jgi:hypothetical protein